MIRSFTAIFLLLALTSSQFSRLFIYAGFELNQNYIASTLCENRNKPELHCNGKCYLMKKLKQAEDKEKKQAQEAQKKGSFDQYILKQTIVLALFSNQIKKNHPAEITSDLPKVNFEVPHPPPSVAIHIS